MKALLSSLAEASWWQLARKLGGLVACRTQNLAPCQRVLVIAPHPDDETVGCAGTLRLHVENGDEVLVLYITSGAASRRVTGTPAEVAALRYQESINALDVLGINRCQRLNLPEHTWKLDALTGPLKKLIDDFLPEVIYSPSQIDGHPDHTRSARALALALELQPKDIEIRCYPVHTPLTPILVNLAIDTTSVAKAVDQAHAAYPSQADALTPIRRMRRYSAAAHGGPTETETFWALDSSTFCAVHDDSWTPGKYCGPRPSAFRDPMAYMQGIQLRLALARRVRGR